jgi:hypothetical protein
MAGALAKAVRVCDASNTEMLWSISDPSGQPITGAAMATGSTLTIPVECPAHGKATYWVYFDNASAWEVPDFLAATGGLRNGGVEQGAGDTPAGWTSDVPDNQHRTFWTTEDPHSGKHCLKTVVAAGADPTWISTRQQGIRIVPGAKYVFSGWVRAQDVVGEAGWYIHIGDATNPMMVSPMATGGAGAYGWKQVQADFVAPAGADQAELGTVLRGTGTAWFDDASLQTDAISPLSATAAAPERLALAAIGEPERWPATVGGRLYAWRIPLRVMNLSDEPAAAAMDAVDLSGITARMARKADMDALQIMDGARLIHHAKLADMLLFDGEKAPALSVRTYYMYLPAGTGPVVESGPRVDTRTTGTSEDAREKTSSGASRVPPITLADYRALIKDPRNLAKNPDFEEGTALPTDWSGGSEGEKPAGTTLGFDTPGLFGKRCVRMEIPKGATPSWTGWRQEIPVRPGLAYLCAVWIRCASVTDGAVQLYGHVLDAKGQVISYVNAGPSISGTTGWTLFSSLVAMPSDAAAFQIHLTANVTGTVWHDGVVFVDVSSADTGALEQRPGDVLVKGVAVWPVNAVVKVFQDDSPATGELSARAPAPHITAARNEKEPLQLAVRSTVAIKSVRVVVAPPRNARGATLGAVQIGVVGYVPIDHTTNYYQSTTPAYYRKFPTGPGSSDGWTGMWPDPLLPTDTFDLAANATQPVWLTVNVPKDAAPGDYTSKVSFVAGGKTLKTLTFTVHVWNFGLPDELHTAAIFDCHPDARWQVPGQTEEQTRWQFWKFMADHRVCPDRIYPDPDIRYVNGKVIADFTDYDRIAHYYFDVLHLPHCYTPSVFYMFGWGFPPSVKFGEAPYEGTYPYAGVDRSKLRPEFVKAVQACLKVYWDHMKAKGWADKIVYYVSDEPFHSDPNIIAQMKALCNMVKGVDPAIPIYSSTWEHVPAWDGYINLWGFGHFGDVSPDTMKAIRATGVRIRYTTDGQMCIDTPYLAVERLLPHYCFEYNVEAYEFWGCTWLTYNPYQFGWHAYIHQSDTPGKSYYVRYPNGDGYIAYPGGPIGHAGPVSSIRMEQAREGVDDYEYLYLLRELVQKAKAAGKDASVGQAALDAASELVSIPNAGGRFSTKILPDPDQIFRVKVQVARAIEQLSRE